MTIGERTADSVQPQLAEKHGKGPTGMAYESTIKTQKHL